ncbi:MAG: GGDEF and EAL domain-containing protein [Ruminococcus sp.]|nr:GGDEF and EAL domain-containing protein [Ruminococcus sp.]
MEKYQFSPEAKSVLEHLRAPLAVYQFIEKRVVTIILSDGFCDLFGFTDKDKAYYEMDHNMYEATHPDDVARIADEAFRFATEGGKYEVVYRTLNMHRTEYRIVHSIGEHVFTPEGVRLAYVWYTDEGSYSNQDDHSGDELNTALRNSLHEEKIIQTGYYDFLTGLPTMSYFFELAEERRKSLIAEGKSAAIVYMDFSGMKYFNRKYGFAEGDKLLRSFANLLKKHFGNEDCGRFGADHFCILTEGTGIENKIMLLFADFEGENPEKKLSVRAGIFADNKGVLEISSCCDRAKYACDTMRKSVVSCFCYFDDSMLRQVENNRYFIENIDRAISEKWIKVYYQPIIRVANGRICDEEALARWLDPEKGMVSPAEFITVLEEAKLIYRLDLYVVEQVVEKMKKQEKAGLYVVPCSVNLSRVDFDSCDIVEEIRRRVDDAGVSRDKLNIEVTESTIGKDFEFMKKQIERFRELGFKVWMDDFGSGYSSLEFLQSVSLDLIKLDMRFIREFDRCDKSKIILTELIKMLIALEFDTVCEGVETKEQAEFLQEVGCAKLQGYYFGRPAPFEGVIERNTTPAMSGYENPVETEYYAAIGKINLYDISTISSENDNAVERYFNTIPMSIIESTGDAFTLIRCNNTYRDFMEKTFGVVAIGEKKRYSQVENEAGSEFIKYLRECGENGGRVIVDEEMPDGTINHSVIKRLAVNPLNGTKALAVAVLSITKRQSATMNFTRIARALSSDYISLYYVDLETNDFIEYKGATANQLLIERSGTDFFRASLSDALRVICPETRNEFISAFTKENILRAIDSQGAFVLNYREYIDKKPTYVSLKAVRASVNDNHIIIGVNNVDVQTRQKEALERMKQEQITHARITALTGDFICIYSVDPETEAYTEYIAASNYSGLEIPKEGTEFFSETLRRTSLFIHPDDLELFKASWSKEAIIKEISEKGAYLHNYRLIIDGKSVHVCLRAAIIEETDGPRIIVGLTNSDADVANKKTTRT